MTTHTHTHSLNLYIRIENKSKKVDGLNFHVICALVFFSTATMETTMNTVVNVVSWYTKDSLLTVSAQLIPYSDRLQIQLLVILSI